MATLERDQSTPKPGTTERPAVLKGYTMMRVKLPVPEGLDPSTVLELAEGFAVELAEYAGLTDDNFDEEEIDRDALGERVSVEVLP